MDYPDLINYTKTDYLDKSVFNFMMLYISRHIADLSTLKSIRVLKELV